MPLFLALLLSMATSSVWDISAGRWIYVRQELRQKCHVINACLSQCALLPVCRLAGGMTDKSCCGTCQILCTFFQRLGCRPAIDEFLMTVCVIR